MVVGDIPGLFMQHSNQLWDQQVQKGMESLEGVQRNRRMIKGEEFRPLSKDKRNWVSVA